MKTPSDAGPIFQAAQCVRSLASKKTATLGGSFVPAPCVKVPRLGGAASGPLERA